MERGMEAFSGLVGMDFAKQHLDHLTQIILPG